MNTAWQEHLAKIGARIANQRVQAFTDATGEAQSAQKERVICDLSHQGLISVAGADATAFLQGQLTNDLKNISPQSSQLNAYCSPKGRVLASFRLFQRDDVYLMELPFEVLASTLQRLRMFVLRSQVVLSDASDEYCRIGVSGPDAGEWLAGLFGDCPPNVDDVRQSGAITLVRIPGPLPRYELHGPTTAMIEAWEKLAKTARTVGYQAWEDLDIISGLPTVTLAIMDTFVPQMLNLHALNGVSFKKGCYPGQEIVARTQYLGKLKRRLYHLHYTGKQPITAGDEILGEGETTQGVGKVVNAAFSAIGGQDILAVLQDTALESPLWLSGHDSPLKVCELPYSLPD